MIEEEKYAILFAATLLCARELIDFDSNFPNAERRCLRAVLKLFQSSVA